VQVQIPSPSLSKKASAAGELSPLSAMRVRQRLRSFRSVSPCVPPECQQQIVVGLCAGGDLIPLLAA
jgi:hypothetical protein